ncbi:M23 family metallopeptidase [Blastococcus tunisiensis]|uniref:Peptidase family M23 n=1 Tax=Blastococcus tunisiensis TaxID=1798228 RepID=A0A1I1WAF7_9ACTN|nr:M23 family metallopeptidase [Blastococcus sp. DSM 46838]SFD92094.1 Peptidase family M23 [Blastococcus sp. DSM 46838]
MARSSAPQVLERSGTERDTASLGAPLVDVAPRIDPAAVLRPRTARDASDTPVVPEPAATGTSTEEDAAVPASRTRRLPQPPGRRAHLWLAALIAGALIAAIPSFTGPSEELTGTASDYGLGVAADLALGGIDDAGVRRSITEAEAQARLGELAASRAARAPKTVLPTQGRLTTCYCMRWGQMHYGLDLAAPLGTPIYSAADGVVIKAGRVAGFGNAVYVQDADGNVHIYGHMRYYDVRAGDLVHAGDQIAKVGNEGFSTGPHLHYEIHRGDIDGRPLDPQDWLAERGVHL